MKLAKYSSKYLIAFIAMFVLIQNCFSQTGPSDKKITPGVPFKLNKELLNKGKRDQLKKRIPDPNKGAAPQRKSVILKKENTPLARTNDVTYSQRELEIMDQMKKIKTPDNPVQEGDKLVQLQKELESINGATSTKQETNSFCHAIVPSMTDVVSSDYIYSGDYVVAIASQVEQRGTGNGKIWIAVGHSGLDTGALATPDSIILYNSTNNGITFTKYVTVAFSPANKIGFDDLDMEIIENTSGTKYIYLVFGYYTQGYFGVRRIGYTVVTTPTLSVFGSTLSFPGSPVSSVFFGARVTSDNARFPSNPYVTISVMQDSLVGPDHYIMTKLVRILSPFNLNPSLTYMPRCIYTSVAGFIDYNVTVDLAHFHNGDDSLVFVLSNYAGYTDDLYMYKAANNTVVYPRFNGVVTPTGDDLEFARIAASGGTNQKRIMISYTDNYNNTGDFDQWFLYTTDANNWISGTLEYNSLHNSKYGDIICRRNADGSFAFSFINTVNSMNNVTTGRFNGNLNLDAYLHCTNTGYANSIASPKPAFRYVNGDSCFNIWSYYYTLFFTRGCSAINFYLSVATEGYYDAVSGVNPNIDSYIVFLANQNPPYNYVDTSYISLDYQWQLNEMIFRHAADGDYYLVLEHQNALETWSATPVTISHSNIEFYDFTSSDAQAYGNNLTLDGAKWCTYSGDLNRDGNIDGTDTQIADNDAYSFVIGQYLISDVNGDFFVDGSDIIIIDNNAVNFVSVVRP